MFNESRQNQPAWLNAQCPREGRYVVGPLLGRGGMGNVHEAWDVILCRTVALKVLKDIEPPALIRFMHEAQIHARVVHPNICRIYDVDNHEGALRVAMQLVHGDNLEHSRRDLSLMELVTVMALVAQAVHVVHRLNLVHRDLKPSNILLERSADGVWVPYVCDFGLAMALDEPALTFSHGILGTPAYMAPEQFRGDRERIGAATDVYALGGTLHFALTGRPPSGPTGSSSAHTPADPPIPRDLRTIIARCLQEDPELRYPTANALAEDLWRFRAGDPIRASHPRGIGRAGRMGRKVLGQARSFLPAAGAALLVLAAWLAYQGHLRTVARQQMTMAQQAVLEAAAAAANLGRERMLPAHDLRPTYARLRSQLEREQSLAAILDPPWQDQVRYALGVTAYLTGDFPDAQAELERAWTAGFQGPEAACLLAEAAIAGAARSEQAAQFDTGLEAAGPGTAAVRAGALLGPNLGPGRPADEYGSALAAFLAKDYLRAASASRACRAAAPWNAGAAVLESASLAALARQDLRSANLAGARSRFGEAMAAARGALAQSDQALCHAYFQAARGLAALDRERGSLALPWLGELQTASDRALLLDPEDPALQDDWLGFRWLRAMRLLDLGQDPQADLDDARMFLDTRAREPLTPALRADRMLVYWLAARRDFGRGSDPGPALTQALKSAGHTPFLFRDYLVEVHNFQARVDASRGVDPRPALAPALEQLAPRLEKGAPWSLRESLAGSWLIRGEWETTHGLDGNASILNALILAETARQQNPASASAYALEGLAQVLELQAAPGRRRELLPMARERLRLSQERGFGGMDQILLKQALLRQEKNAPS
jgi:serine/threonine-protein kinase